MSSIVNGAVQLKINKTNLINFSVIIPTNDIINGFNEIIKPMFEKIKNNTNQIKTLSKTRDILLSKLISGEKRISEFE